MRAMAVKSDPEIHTPKSTGAVKFDGEPTVTSQPADAKSMGAVEYAAPGETKLDHLDADVTVVVPTSGPTTMSVSWLPEAKVVSSPDRAEPKTSAAEVTTKSKD